MKKNSPDVRIRYYSSVQARDVQWLWYPYIPFGKITVIQGDPGDGKTTLILNLAALLTRGLPMPTSERTTEQSVVLYQSAEDGAADTIKPRLVSAGADCNRIGYIDAAQSEIAMDSPLIERAIEESGARLLVLDPLQAYLSAENDLHRANDMRPIMAHLSAVAERTNCAIVIISHLNKASSMKGIYRGLGSIDIPAAARSVLLVGRLKSDPSIRVMTHLKSSLAPEGAAVAFDMSDTQGLRWIGEYDINSDDLLNGTDTLLDESKREKAIAIISERLKDGMKPCNEIYEVCYQSGISKRTVDSVKRDMCIKSIKRTDCWYWSI